MEQLELFKNRKKINVDDIDFAKLLFVMANIDNEISDEEIKLIISVMQQKGMSNEDIMRCYEEVKSGNNHFKLPESEEDKADALVMIVSVMEADGVVTPQERQFCQEMSRIFGFEPETADYLIESWEE